MDDDKLRIIYKKCGELRPMKAFEANFKTRICNKYFEPPAEATTDLVKHVQGPYKKKKHSDCR